MIWRMGHLRIVEMTYDDRSHFISKTLVPNIMHVNCEARTEGSRWYSVLYHGSSHPRTFVDGKIDILMIGDGTTLEALWSPENAYILGRY